MYINYTTMSFGPLTTVALQQYFDSLSTKVTSVPDGMFVDPEAAVARINKSLRNASTNFIEAMPKFRREVDNKYDLTSPEELQLFLEDVTNQLAYLESVLPNATGYDAKRIRSVIAGRKKIIARHSA
jgi:hypothetical protein